MRNLKQGLRSMTAISWKTGILTGLVPGIIFLFLPSGMPWIESGVVTPKIMGRELIEPYSFGVVAGWHLLLAIVYGLLIAPAIHFFPPLPAVYLGATLGLALYFLNRFAIAPFFPMNPDSPETVPLFIHIAFGLIAASLYKGLIRRNPAA